MKLKFTFGLICCLSLLGCVKTEEEIPPEAQVEYAFFVAGHTYGKPGEVNNGLHPLFENHYDLIRNWPMMDFGVLTGDIVQKSTVETWDNADSSVRELGMPVYYSFGNHDMVDPDLVESRYGAFYYSIQKEDDLHIILDGNQGYWNIVGDQYDFLRNTVESSPDVRNIFIYLHQMIWWTPDSIFKNVRTNSLVGRSDDSNFWTEVEPLLNHTKAPFVTKENQNVYFFAGDVGATWYSPGYMYYAVDNIHLIASGMGHEDEENFIIVEANDDGSVDFELIALTGERNRLGKLEDYILP